MEVKLSEKFATKLVETVFEKTSKSNWFTTIYKYCIDSRFRTYIRLDKFLKDQIDNPDPELLGVAGKFMEYDFDKRIVEILKYVRGVVKYKRDIDNFGTSEYWASAAETYTKKSDDCDGINGLVYVIARLSGIPSYCIYCAIGDTNSGGHFWCIYLSTKTDNIHTIDGTYYYSSKEIKNREVFKFSDSKYRSIWYLFNENYIFKTK